MRANKFGEFMSVTDQISEVRGFLDLAIDELHDGDVEAACAILRESKGVLDDLLSLEDLVGVQQ